MNSFIQQKKKKEKYNQGFKRCFRDPNWKSGP